MLDEMSSCAEMMMVPQELVTEILSRLPVKSLLRFKCTCTSWYHLINSPFFVNLHLTTAAALKIKENNNYTILTETTNPGSSRNVYVGPNSRFSLVSGDTFHVIRDVILPCFGRFGFRTSGHCNGLFCLFDLNYAPPYSGDIALWNPATRKLKMLPGSPFPTQWGSRIYFVAGYGFGFDAAAISSDSDYDYKVVKIVRLLHVEGKKYFRAYVYSLKKNCWREVSGPPPAAEVSLFQRQCCAYHNGSYHWFNLRHNTILSFDMHAHVFHVSSLPLVGLGEHWMANFAVRNDSLAVVVHSSIEEADGVYQCRSYCGQASLGWYDILVQNEVSKTWSKQARVVDCPCMHTRVCINGTAIGHDGEDHLVSYNPETRELKKIKVYGWQLFTIVTFTESLVSVNGGDEGDAL